MKQESQKSERSMEPVEEADMGVEVRCAEALQQLCQTKAKITQLVDPARCTVKGDGVEGAEVHKKAEVTLITNVLTNNKTTRCSAVVVGQLKSLYNQSVIQCDVDQSGPGKYCIQYTPTVRGRHELIVSVDGQRVAGSPIPVFVSIPPTQLGNPVSIWKDIPKPTGISMNSRGELIVLKEEGDVLEFYKAGEKLRSIGRNLLKLDSYTFTSIPVDAEDFMYFYSYDSNTMMKLNKDGHVVKKVNISSKLYGARIVGNELFACERDGNTIAVYDRELNFVRRIEQGKETGGLRDNSEDSDGNIYATNWDRKCIVIFGPQGDYRHSFDYLDEEEVSILTMPLGLFVAGRYVYVCNNGLEKDKYHSVYVFTTDGEFVTKFGHKGSKEGEFNESYAVFVDDDGFVYVCDHLNNRIQVF